MWGAAFVVGCGGSGAETAGASSSDGATRTSEVVRWFEPVQGATTVVWTPAAGRYVNEPTLVYGADARWHVYANGGEGDGSPWVENQLLHASAPRLDGPWTDHDDVLTTRDPMAREWALHAPFAFGDGDLWRLWYFDGSRPNDEGLFEATSTDLVRWTRAPGVLPGGRDPCRVRTDDGRELLYTVGVQREADGDHDVILLHERRDGGAWRSLGAAVRNPTRCPKSCWGWYESPFVLTYGGWWYLLVTDTSSIPTRDDYQRTRVFVSSAPERFPATPAVTLRGHGAELHEEDGRWFLTAGGWPGRLAPEPRGLRVSSITWVAREGRLPLP